jgi:hypothetical protein
MSRSERPRVFVMSTQARKVSGVKVHVFLLLFGMIAATRDVARAPTRSDQAAACSGA